MTLKNFRRIQVGVALLLLIALLFGFKEMLLHHAPDVFRAKEEDMDYAWFVPLYSLYVLWSERKKTIAACAAGRPSLWGVLLALPCLILGLFGARGLQVRFEIVGFIGMLVAIPWAVFGWQAAKRFIFPALFLCFCIPLSTFLDIVTVHLRLFATSVAFNVMNGLGMDVVRRGTMLAAENGSFHVDVADPCGGMRSLFAIMALTAGYAYFTQRTWIRRGILFLCSIPFAIAGNVVRIISICLVAHFTTESFALGYYHDFSWLPIYGVALILLVACSEIISRVGYKKESAAAGNAASAAVLEEKGGGRMWSSIVLVLAALVLVPSLVWQAQTPRPRLMDAPRVAAPTLKGYTYEVLQPSEQEVEVLPKDTQFIKRLYISDKAENIAVSWVIGGASKSSIHRPELCLPAQGYQMSRPRTINVDGRTWREISLETNGEVRRHFAYTFFNQAGYRTSSHMARIWKDVWDRSILNRIDRWVMITVYGDVRDEKRFQQFLSELMKESAY